MKQYVCIMYQKIIKPVLFLVPPEKAHSLTMAMLSLVTSLPVIRSWISKFFRVSHASLERNLWGLHFSNPVGLAAGFDKDGKHIDALSYLGFGFIEIGTITPRPQSGNPKPRLFRIPQEEALINRMGFNNGGMDAAAGRLRKNGPFQVIVGGNIGKNKDTPNEDAVADYLSCFRTLYPYVDYFVVNVSSPNTPGLRALQEKEPLSQLLNALMAENKKQPKPKPILLKIAPDLSREQLDDIIELVHSTGIHGVIATNTTIDRSKLQTDTSDTGPGGLSGRPLKDRSTEVIRYLHSTSGGSFPIIGVGGIDSADAAIEKLNAGAALVQVYSGLVFKGPMLIKKINKALIGYEGNQSFNKG